MCWASRKEKKKRVEREKSKICIEEEYIQAKETIHQKILQTKEFVDSSMFSGKKRWKIIAIKNRA